MNKSDPNLEVQLQLAQPLLLVLGVHRLVVVQQVVPEARGRVVGPHLKVARWQNLIPSFPWIAPVWRAWGRNPRKRRDQIFAAQRSGAIVQKPEGPNTYDLKIWLSPYGNHAPAAATESSA